MCGSLTANLRSHHQPSAKARSPLQTHQQHECREIPHHLGWGDQH